MTSLIRCLGIGRRGKWQGRASQSKGQQVQRSSEVALPRCREVKPTLWGTLKKQVKNGMK